MQIADLHLHSKYSRACSKNLDIENLEKWGRVKGIDILASSDYTHPIWIKELKAKLKEDTTGEDGIFKTSSGYNFLLSTEISLVYTDGGKGRRIHLIVLAPNFDVVDQITEYLKSKGRIDYDGRPIFKILSSEFVYEMKKISQDIEIIPAHCLLPDEKIICKSNIKSISKIENGDKVLTHTGEYHNVTETYVREYEGSIYKIQPYYFKECIQTTDEHPFLAIKTVKNCSYVGGLCKPNSTAQGKHKCKIEHYKNYHPEWLPARELEVNDVLLYPRQNKTIDKDFIKLSEVIGITKYVLKGEAIAVKSGRQDKALKNQININAEFCRLIGYYLAEGYVTTKNNCIQFCFNKNEQEYISDVTLLMKKCFGLEIIKKRIKSGSMELYFYSKIISELFTNLFYEKNKPLRAAYKKLPQWMIYLPKQKQKEILIGWWRGDCGVTVSEMLCNQMKFICLRLGIIPSIYVDSKEKINNRKNIINGRRIISAHDIYNFQNLSFHEDDFHLLEDKCFKKFKTKLSKKHGWMDEDYVYMPIKNIRKKYYKGPVYNIEVEKDNSYVTPAATVHNCMTPWFGVFGSKSGYDSLKECFKDQLKHINALETGLSSDPSMLYRVKEWRDYSFVSNSDSHSFWPWRLGREATLFDLKKISYNNFIKSIRDRALLGTIEVDPNYGIYHYTGHRNCHVVMSPSEAAKVDNICPVCHNVMTIGVDARIEMLADKPAGFYPANGQKYYKMLPLSELIAGLHRTSMISKKAWEIYYRLIKEFKSEYNILLDVGYQELLKIVEKPLI